MKRWMPSPPALVTKFDTAVRPLRGVAKRRMFGYPAVFVNGHMFAGLLRDTMVLRLGDDDRARFLRLPGATPFVAMKGRVMKQWAVVPHAMLSSRTALSRWLGRSLAYARSLPPKAPRRTRRQR
jgi:TfoX/Sxy family transcriptional regulator of competence genes